jgi:hypothetical protein
MALANFLEAMKKKGPSAQIKAFEEKYIAQMHRVQKAHMALERSTKTSMSGQSPHQVATVNVDDDQWIAFNKEYYKLREMEYYAGYKIPEVVALRGKARAVTKTEEMGDIKSHWKEVTQQKQHQVVAHH